MSKISKILVISSKGGVGKSTISTQIITPYLYIHNSKKPIKYYEFDDENRDYLSFAASNLSLRKNVQTSNNFLREDIVEIFSKNESLCVDIGGNKTTTLAIKAFRDSGMIHLVDLVIIPLLDGEQDGINASAVYSTLKKLSPEIKVLFILNKVKDIKKLKYQFENYFGDPREIFSNRYALKTYLKNNDFNNVAVMLDDDVIKYSRRFGLTIYEIAKQKRNFISELKKNMDNYSSEQEIKLTSFKNYMDNASKDYYNNIIVPIFKKIDKILKK